VNSDSDGGAGGDQPRGDDEARRDKGADASSTAGRSGSETGSDVGADQDSVIAGLEADLAADTDADTAADDGEFEREPVTVGARATAGSARAAARASAARAGVTAAKGRPTASRDRTKNRVGPAARIARYLREVVSELRKVIWPTRNEMITYSVVVVLFLVFMVAVTWGADFGFARLILWIFG